MKVTESIHSPPRRSTREPRFSPPKLPSQGVENTLAIVALVLLVFGTAVWYVSFATRNGAVPVTDPKAGLELVFSGAVTSTLSLAADELKAVRCSPNGFQLESTRETAFPLELAFSGAAGRANSSYHNILGSNSTFSLRVNGTAYTLLSGTVTFTQGVHTFNASLINAQSQPLQVSGRLLCP